MHCELHDVVTTFMDSLNQRFANGVARLTWLEPTPRCAWILLTKDEMNM